MPIEFKVPSGLADKILANGALDGDEVWVQFICQTGELGQHDPNDAPDSHVRPSHAAFHGQIFRVDEAPIPPLDYGCRCAIHYVAKPGSDAADVIKEESPEEETVTPDDATRQWLDANVPEWDKLRRVAQDSAPGEAIGKVQAKAKELGITQPRAIAQMVVDVTPPSGPGPGVAIQVPRIPPAAPSASVAELPTPQPAPSPQPAAAAPITPIATPEELPLVPASTVVRPISDGQAADYERRAAKVLPKVTESQEAALYNYSGSAYAAIRAADAGRSYDQWRAANKLDDTQQFQDLWRDAQKDAKNINSAFGKAQTTATTVYRGMREVPDAAVLDMVSAGEVVLDSLTSTSYNPIQAQEFLNGFVLKGQRAVLLKILNAKGLLMEAFSSREYEQEFLLQKGGRFKIISAVRTMLKDTETVVITMEAL